MHKLRRSDWPDNEWDTFDKVIQWFEQIIQPKNNNQIKKYVLELSNYRQTTESLSDLWTKLKRRLKVVNASVTRSSDECKHCAWCQ